MIVHQKCYILEHYNVVHVILHKYVNAHQTLAYVCMDAMFQKFTNKINNNLLAVVTQICYVTLAKKQHYKHIIGNKGILRQ